MFFDRLPRRRRPFALECLEPRVVLDGSVAFNEVMYHSAGSDPSQDWVELYNQMSVDMDLSDWSLEGGIAFAFPKDTTLPAGGYLVVAASPNTLQKATGFADAFGPFTGQLSNRGETLELRDSETRLMDVLSYDDQYPWPVAADGSGVSLAKLDGDLGSDRAENWDSSLIVNGSPGHHNSNVTPQLIRLDSPWQYEESDSNLGTAWRHPGFDDSSWLSGNGLLFNENGDLPGPKNTTLTVHVTPQRTYYFRTEFAFFGDPATSQFQLKHVIDDGAVFYLNGNEIGRYNMPSGTIDHSTLASQTIGDATLMTQTSIDWSNLQLGTNTFAVEVHQASPGSQDIVLGAELSVVTDHEPLLAGQTLVLNEISGDSASVFEIEIANSSNQSIDLSGFVLQSTADPADRFVFSGPTLAAGGFANFNETQLGFRPASGEKLFLYDASATLVLDAVIVDSVLRGRSPAALGRWLYPSTATFGTSNHFNFEDQVVINEIMFHHKAFSETPATMEETELVAIDALWKYNQVSPIANQGSAWRNPGFNDSVWPESPALFFAETATLPAPKNTPLTLGTTTYYFRHEFQFSGDPANVELSLDALIDDGAIFYLNGVEVERINLSEGTVTHSTFASPTVGNATFSGLLPISSANLSNGTNVLAVEVHQSSPVSNDVVFGTQLLITQTTPGTPYHESTEEWVELYNRGNQSVDLTGWQLADGIHFSFPPQTIMGPGDYLVVANDFQKLSLKYPTATILGNFDKQLNNDTDRIELRDAFGNPADEVEYYDGGRWPLMADGRGSSLELLNPRADNSKAEVWAASDETQKTTWQTFTYTGIATAPTFNPSKIWNEFLIGLLDEGEILIDDIRVVQSPGGGGAELIQNGDFENGDAAWRILGTHVDSRVMTDPDDPSNHVLHLVASGPKHHFNNRVETTFLGNTPIANNTTYELSFRARWLTGSHRLHTEVYYTRLANTTLLSVPQDNGTPGSQNSRFQTNTGPTYSGLAHQPVVPNAGQAVTVTVESEDSDNVSNLTLWYSVDEGSWKSVGMSRQANHYQATIPGQSTAALVQFYVQGQDALGTTSTYPAAGPDSRVLYRVQDGQANTSKRHSFRILMTDTDTDILHLGTNVASNDRLGATVIYDEQQVFYNVGARLKGSIVTRGKHPTIVGFNVLFDPDHLFRGSLKKIGVKTAGRQEILVKHIINHAGGLPTRYDDFVHLVRPTSVTNGPAIMTLDPYGTDYLDAQFDNGSDGTVYKMEGVSYQLTTTDGNPESLKIPQPLGWISAVDLEDLGDDKEQYRWMWLLQNGRDRDDYSGLITLAKTLGLTGADLEQQANQVLDVDQFMRTFAFMSLVGANDAYSQGMGGAPHNIDFYAPPDNGKIIALPWDWDDAFVNRPYDANLWGNKNIANLIQRPVNTRIFHGHLLDIINTTFNSTYMTPWANHYKDKGAENYGFHLNFIHNRANYVLDQLPTAIPFQVNSNNGADFSVNTATVDLNGQGWIDVHEIRFAGSSDWLPVTWLDDQNWQITLPVSWGENLFQLEAYDRQGTLVGSDRITVTSTSTDASLQDSLRITELNYHPHDPTAAELAIDPTLKSSDFEFIELENIGSKTIRLTDARFLEGIEFTFPISELNSGQRAVIVENTTAFALRYGTEVNVLGEFNGSRLSNNGERLHLVDSSNTTIQDFSYGDSDPWPDRADGAGATLELIDSASTTPEQFGKFYHWRGSIEMGGSPGFAGQEPVGIVINEILSHTGPPLNETDSIELLNITAEPIDIGGWFLSDSSDNFFKYQIPSGTLLGSGQHLVFDENHFNPTPLSPDTLDFALSGNHGDDVWLTDPNGGGAGVMWFVDDVQFPAATHGESFGRVPDGSGRLSPLLSRSLGNTNGPARVGPLVISEVNYHPGPPSTAALAIDPNLMATDLEFVEIHNTSNSDIDLSNWRLRQEIDFDFPTGIMSGKNQTLVLISFDPTSAANTNRVAAFRVHYGIDTNVALVGGYVGQLSNSDARIVLQRPGIAAVEESTVLPRLSEDEVVYDDFSPWPTSADGGSASLHRTRLAGVGSHSASWTAGTPLPGQPARQGDTDLDGDVDTSDLTKAIINFTGAGGVGKNWAQGDVDGDRDVDTGDLTIAIINFTGAMSTTSRLTLAGVPAVAGAKMTTHVIATRLTEHPVDLSREADTAKEDASLSNESLEQLQIGTFSRSVQRSRQLHTVDRVLEDWENSSDQQNLTSCYSLYPSCTNRF